MTFVSRVLLLVVTAAAICAAGEAEWPLAGNWSVSWLSDGRPFGGLVLESTLSGLLVRAESRALFSRAPSRCVPPSLADAAPSMRAEWAAGGLRLFACGASLLLPAPTQRAGTARAALLTKPLPIRLQSREDADVDGCGPPVASLRGYWIDRPKRGVRTVALFIRRDGVDCAAVLQLRRRGGTGGGNTHEYVKTAALLVLMAAAKFLPRRWRTNPRVMPHEKRRELLRQQEEIIQRMREQDGSMEGTKG